jgi:pimeloyl-ACP methyl ester carboxylesterase
MSLLADDVVAVIAHACGTDADTDADDTSFAACAPHVLGWSLGAGVALQLGVSHPRLARSLCLFGFSACSHGAPTVAAAATRALLASPHAVTALGVLPHGALLAALLRFRRGGPTERAAARRAIHAANSLSGYRGCVAAWHPFDVTARLQTLRAARVLHLHTALDGELAGHTLAKKTRDAALICGGGGRCIAEVRTEPGPWTHAWPFEEPSSFNAAVLRFLREAEA